MISSGLDWSGSPGGAHGLWLVFALAHGDQSARQSLCVALARVRGELRLTPEFPFRHSETTARTRNAFFVALRQTPVSVHAFMLNTSSWTPQNVSGTGGADCICDGIVTLLARCPREVVNQHLMYIDLPRGEGKLVERYRTTIRQALRRAKQPAFRDLKPRSEDPQIAALIQVADMVAGEIREHGGLDGPHLPALRSRVFLV